MTAGTGSQELVRIATAYLASIAFGVTFLIATIVGADPGTALFRSALAAVCAAIAGQFLVSPVVHTVLSAMARDEAKKQAEQAAAEEDA